MTVHFCLLFQILETFSLGNFSLHELILICLFGLLAVRKLFWWYRNVYFKIELVMPSVNTVLGSLFIFSWLFGYVMIHLSWEKHSQIFLWGWFWLISSLRYMLTSSQKIIFSKNHFVLNCHKKARNYQEDETSFFFVLECNIWAMHFISN